MYIIKKVSDSIPSLGKLSKLCETMSLSQKHQNIFFLQSCFGRPQSGGPDLQRRVDVQPQELEEDFPLNFAPGSMVNILLTLF